MPRPVSSRQKKQREDRKKIQDVYRFVFGSPQGKKLLEDLKKSVGYGKTLYQEGSTNQDLHFHQGRQSIINDIVGFLDEELITEE